MSASEDTVPFEKVPHGLKRKSAAGCTTRWGPLTIQKIISGGQTGADLAALEAAAFLNIATGGWTPTGFSKESKKNEELCELYGLKDLPPSERAMGNAARLVARSRRNVDDSDATLVFQTHSSPGTDGTVSYCASCKWTKREFAIMSDKPSYRPYIIITESVNHYRDVSSVPSEYWKEDVKRLHKFLVEHNVKTLNVAGHRQDSRVYPEWQLRVKNFIVFALTTSVCDE